jgi:hypothetical protein
MFRDLDADLRNDVAQRNKQNGKNFTVQQRQNEIAIMHGDAGPVRAFHLMVDRILVQNRNRSELLSAIVILNNEGRCILKVGEEELERWQFLRKALEVYSFDIDYDDAYA